MVITQPISMHISLMQSLIMITSQNHAILYNKILSKFRKQFAELSNVSNTHVNVEDSSAFMKELQTKSSVMSIEGIKTYKCLDAANAMKKALPDNTLAKQINEQARQLSNSINAFAAIIPPIQTPIMVVTEEFLRVMPKESVKPVLYHEYGHIKNNDNIGNFYKIINLFCKNKLNIIKYLFSGFRTFEEESAADMVAVEFCGADNTIKALQDLLDTIYNEIKNDRGILAAVKMKTLQHEIYARIGRIKGERDD